MRQSTISLTALLVVFSSTSLAGAQESSGASASFSLSTSDGASADASVDGDGDGVGYMQRYKPVPNLWEIGIFGGVLFPSSSHNFHNENRTHEAYSDVAPDVGARVGYYPLSFLGAELEGAVMPATTADTDEAGGLWAIRGHVVGQLPTMSIVPFLLVGGGRMGAGANSMGSDSDPLFHFGGGVKVPLDEIVGVRLDVRDNLTQKNNADDGTLTHHPEILAALTLTLDRSAKKEPPPPPQDSDGDGFADPDDECPNEPGVAPKGCPSCPTPDTDGDGFLDPDDQCPREAGIAPDGCPDKDPDKDGVLNPDDKCPDVAGVAPDGCPDNDPDKDGIPDPADKCPAKPETRNGYQDTDGCPDEVPEAVKKFTGVIQGIEFDTGLATIRPGSRPTLDGAAKVLTDFPDIRVLISGHTDNVGQRDKNLTLSQNRAASVKKYLVAKGIKGDRIKTRGAGPDEPIADNKTPAGRQKNRRIEFKLIK